MNSGPKWSLRNGAQYRRLCARPGCGAAAVATLRFQSTQRQAWLIDLDVNASRTQGDLCQRHAAALVLPRGWELHDERAPGAWSSAGSGTAGTKSSGKSGGARRTRTRAKKTTTDAPPAAALPGLGPVATPPPEPAPEAPAPVVEQPAPIPEPQVDEPEPVAQTEPPGNGHAARPVPAQFGTSDEEDVEEELGEILDARTPLLQRAFRNAKPLTDDDEPASSPSGADAPEDDGE